MISSLYEQNLSTESMKMPETILITPNDQLLTTTIEDMYRHIDERHQSTDTLSSPISKDNLLLISSCSYFNLRSKTKVINIGL